MVSAPSVGGNFRPAKLVLNRPESEGREARICTVIPITKIVILDVSKGFCSIQVATEIIRVDVGTWPLGTQALHS